MRKQGFSLIEILIVMTMIGILTGVAVASYQGYVRKSRRTEAMQILTAIQMAQEKHRLTNTTYGSLSDVWGGITSTPNGYYNLQISNTSGTGYTLTATAQGNQANDSEDGTSCTTMTLTLNQATITKSPTNCW